MTVEGFVNSHTHNKLIRHQDLLISKPEIFIDYEPPNISKKQINTLIFSYAMIIFTITGWNTITQLVYNVWLTDITSTFMFINSAIILMLILISYLDFQSGREIYVVSYRWREINHPDPNGESLDYIISYLRNNRIYGQSNKFIFIDYCCLPQYPKSDYDSKNFKLWLKSMNNLYKNGTMIQLLSVDYYTRAWCAFECLVCHTGVINFSNTPLALRLIFNQRRWYWVWLRFPYDVSYVLFMVTDKLFRHHDVITYLNFWMSDLITSIPIIPNFMVRKLWEELVVSTCDGDINLIYNLM